MFDVGAGELLVILIVAILVIGPKDMPMALRAAGRWIGKLRRMSAHFRAGIDNMIREAEMEDMEKKWAERNREIMARYPDGGLAGSADDGRTGTPADLLDGEMRPLDPPDIARADAAAEAAIERARPTSPGGDGATGAPPSSPPPTASKDG